MTRLTEWSFKELERMRSDFDQILDRLRNTSWLSGEGQTGTIRPHVEAYLEEGKLTVRADMPGINPESIDVGVNGNILTIRGNREERKESTKRDFLHRQVRYGSYEYSMTLPPGIKGEDVKALYRDGVLELSAEVPTEFAPTEVKVQVQRSEAETVIHRDRNPRS